MNSKRTYIVVGIEGEEVVRETYSLKDLVSNDNIELICTLQEDIDSILDLKKGEAKYIRLSRDGSQEDLGVIKRIS